jgi:hypothetical protein
MKKSPLSYERASLSYGLGVVIGSAGGAVGAGGWVVCWIEG